MAGFMPAMFVLAGLQKRKAPDWGRMGAFPCVKHTTHMGGSVVCDCATDQETWTL